MSHMASQAGRATSLSALSSAGERHELVRCAVPLIGDTPAWQASSLQILTPMGSCDFLVKPW